MPVPWMGGNPYGGGSSWSGWGPRKQKREQGSSDADGTQPNPGELAVDQSVRAQWKDQKWYTGKVKELNADGTVKIFWTAFKNYTDSVSLENIRVGGSVPDEA